MEKSYKHEDENQESNERIDHLINTLESTNKALRDISANISEQKNDSYKLHNKFQSIYLLLTFFIVVAAASSSYFAYRNVSIGMRHHL